MRAVALFAILFLTLPVVEASERLSRFHADILVHADGTLEVTETIVAEAEGKQIVRGIVRDYPTKYRDRLGNTVQVDYQPLDLLRNGRQEAFHFEPFENGIRTYFGSREHILEHGTHDYTFRYRAGRMLGFFEDRDELYWNAVPFGGGFPVTSASASVRFDFDIAAQELLAEAYTGRYGESGQEYSVHISADATVNFQVNRPLAAGEGLSIVVSWPAGYVTRPTQVERAGWLLSDNKNLLVALAGLALLWLYYVPVWRHFGKDPEAGVVMTRYEPPRNFSPASLRYIRKMSYDMTTMTSAVVNLAVKGYLRITQSGDIHTLQKQDAGLGAPPLAAGEQALYEALFDEHNSVVLTDSEHQRIARAQSAHRKALKRDYANRYFRSNGAMNLPAILIGVAAGIIALAIGVPTAAVFITIVAMIVTILFFAVILKKPTIAGRKLLDEMEGFTEYLEIAEKEELNLRNPPEKTPQLFEKWLPFALAAGVEQAWAEKFQSVLASIRGSQGSYSPAWYHGSWNTGNLAKTASALGTSLNTSISSAATPPGSSSGSSGGGFAGGGGGGGGVGGW